MKEDTIFRLKDVKQITGLGRSSIYKFSKLGTFPEQRELGPRAVGWNSREVSEWVAARPVARKRNRR